MSIQRIIPDRKCCICGGQAQFQGFSGKWFCWGKNGEHNKLQELIKNQ